jgi:hypothetical protein
MPSTPLTLQRFDAFDTSTLQRLQLFNAVRLVNALRLFNAFDALTLSTLAASTLLLSLRRFTAFDRL